jgi:hypothetical protein
LPAHTSLRTALMMAQNLNPQSPRSYAELSELTNLNDKTVANIVRDLIMFGVATGGQSQARLDGSLAGSTPEQVLRKLRYVLKHHALTMSLSQREQGTWITEADIVNLLKEINPAAQHQERTWKVYVDRMRQWLSATGYIVPGKGGWTVEDQGDVDTNFAKVSVGYYRQEGVFTGDSSPAKTVEALEWLISGPPRSWSEAKAAGYRNAAMTLRSLQVITNIDGKYSLTDHYERRRKAAVEIVWDAVSKETILLQLIDYLHSHPSASGDSVGQFVNDKYERIWSPASKLRIGNSLKQWAQWLMVGKQEGYIPEPPGRRSKSQKTGQLTLF